MEKNVLNKLDVKFIFKNFSKVNDTDGYPLHPKFEREGLSAKIGPYI